MKVELICKNCGSDYMADSKNSKYCNNCFINIKQAKDRSNYEKLKRHNLTVTKKSVLTL